MYVLHTKEICIDTGVTDQILTESMMLNHSSYPVNSAFIFRHRSLQSETKK